ncbi:MAG: hypothetical protein QGI86_06655 [Candidatus Poribacteria bacterium]|nr:hypothetical protein [Candidatus Poribacteria bacterium]MDP6745573.1 hypothetical protein [Candidatus Poribacteria bacterium]
MEGHRFNSPAVFKARHTQLGETAALIQTHEGQSTVTFQRMMIMVLYDRFRFPLFLPEIKENLAIMFIGLARSFLLIVVFTSRQPIIFTLSE